MNLDSIYYPETLLKLKPFENILKDYPPDFLVALYVTTEESIRRRGGEGRIVTREFVTTYNSLLKDFIDSLGINKTIVSTDNMHIEEVVETVKNSILENMRSHR